MHPPDGSTASTALFVIAALYLVLMELVLPAAGAVIGCILARKRSRAWYILAVLSAGILLFFAVRTLFNMFPIGEFMDLLHVLAGPVIGGLIGYFTNYIAIRMLFRPVKAVYIGKWRVPFTPGIVPRRKDELASILGKAVVDRFFNGDDLSAVFLSERFRTGVTDAVLDALEKGGGIARIKTDMPKEAAAIRDKLADELCYRIREALLEADLPQLAAVKGGQFIRNSLGEIPAARFLTDDMIASMAQPVGMQLERYVASDARPIIRAMVEKELEKLEKQPAGAILEGLGLNRDTLAPILGGVYDGFMQQHVRAVVSTVDISAQIEKKVKDMSPLELEGLVLSVVKRELNGVVWIGALLGFVIGIVNSLL